MSCIDSWGAGEITTSDDEGERNVENDCVKYNSYSSTMLRRLLSSGGVRHSSFAAGVRASTFSSSAKAATSTTSQVEYVAHRSDAQQHIARVDVIEVESDVALCDGGGFIRPIRPGLMLRSHFCSNG